MFARHLIKKWHFNRNGDKLMAFSLHKYQKNEITA